MCDWSEEEAVAWLKTLRQRVGDLRRDHRIVYISLFKNEGRDAGATMSHCHTQLIALPLVPKANRDRYRRSYEHFQTSGQSLMESILLHEEEMASRIVEKKGEFIAFCPYASAYPFEVIISSINDAGQIDTLSRTRIETIASLLVSTMQRLRRQLGIFHFNLCVSTPNLVDMEGIGSNDLCRFTIRIMPRLYHHGGFEHMTGISINPVLPELAAKLLRESNHE
jgi:UDPglucose--hexose-1-phosphate uridylyltransferase